MSNQDDERIDRVPVLEPKVGEDTISIRLSGPWLTRWRTLMECAGDASKVDVLRDCLSLAFACASLDAHGQPVQVILRRNDKNGNAMPEEDLIDFLGLRTIQQYRNARNGNNK